MVNTLKQSTFQAEPLPKGLPSAPLSNSLLSIEARRKQAATLLEAVIEERLMPAVALSQWPLLSGVSESSSRPVKEDPSLLVAYQTLWFFEADSDDRHHQETFYLDAQLQLLNLMMRYFSLGKPLPEYLLSAYSAEHQTAYYQTKSYWQMVLDSFTGVVNFCCHKLQLLWDTALRAIR